MELQHWMSGVRNKQSPRATAWIITLSLFASSVLPGNVFGQKNRQASKMEKQARFEYATFGSGCFWCTEAIFLNVDGVVKVESGYTGGHVKNPTYKEVCSGLTGHAEVVKLKFDPQKVSYDQLLEIFWQTHDTTTLNQPGSGAGAGRFYRQKVGSIACRATYC